MPFIKLSPGMREITRGLGESFRALAGYLFIFLWWIYLKFKFKFAPSLPLLFVIAAIADFSMLLIEGFLAADKEFHRVSHGWVGAFPGVRSEAVAHIFHYFDCASGFYGLASSSGIRTGYPTSFASQRTAYHYG
jgi:hypothetical protein